jgi:Coenzyme PQQ synthesis protein D (PqqD)
MLELNQRLEPCTEEVAAKVIDGEAILINLATGVYYSMDKVGALMWEIITAKHSLEQIIATVTRRYEVSREQATADVRRLGDELLQEKLVKLMENGTAVASTDETDPTERQVYEAPVLNIYRDMGDLLALDPPTPGLENYNWKDPEEEPK